MNYKIIEKYIEKFSEEILSQPINNHEGWACELVYREFLEPLEIESVIELGAGAGTLLYMFPETMTRHGLSKGNEQQGYIEGDMNTPPVEDNAYDLVIARHTVEHSLMPMIMLCEMARITKKYALVVVPTCTKDIAEMINHYAVFTLITWRAMFMKAGFNVVKENLNQPIYQDNPNQYYEDRFLLELK